MKNNYNVISANKYVSDFLISNYIKSDSMFYDSIIYTDKNLFLEIANFLTPEIKKTLKKNFKRNMENKELKKTIDNLSKYNFQIELENSLRFDIRDIVNYVLKDLIKDDEMMLVSIIRESDEFIRNFNKIFRFFDHPLEYGKKIKIEVPEIILQKLKNSLS